MTVQKYEHIEETSCKNIQIIMDVDVVLLVIV